MQKLKPFFTFYGGKWRAAPHYPQPTHSVIVEPFAGAAGYSVRNPDRNVRLYDVDPVIVGVWSYLIRATEAEILALPDVSAEGVDALPSAVPQEARWLIGFWLNKGSSRPCRTPSAWMRGGTAASSFWGPSIRERIASQVSSIRHWQMIHCSYADIPVAESATWFVDPPYNNKAGSNYKCSDVDYSHLAGWCQGLPGQVVVCENAGADWLPFREFRDIKANPSARGGKVSKEVIWTND